jgi:hypothetical protein
VKEMKRKLEKIKKKRKGVQKRQKKKPLIEPYLPKMPAQITFFDRILGMKLQTYLIEKKTIKTEKRREARSICLQKTQQTKRERGEIREQS